MIFERYRDLFDDCPPVFWPWLWLQLAWLLALKAEDGRERMIMVSPWGKVIVLLLGDDPNAVKGWQASDLAPYLDGAGHWSRRSQISASTREGRCPWTDPALKLVWLMSVPEYPPARASAAGLYLFSASTDPP